jgi:hypothetical protein
MLMTRTVRFAPFAAMIAIWSTPSGSQSTRSLGAVFVAKNLTKLTFQSVLVERGAHLPFLGADGDWKLHGKPVDIARYVQRSNVRVRRAQYVVAVVSLGRKPTYGQFLRTAVSLRESRICDVAILEGGEVLGGQVGVPAFTIC